MKVLLLSSTALLLAAELPNSATARCLNTTTSTVLGNGGVGQPSSNQTVVCDTSGSNPTPYVISATSNSSNVTVTVLPGSIISPGVRAIGVVNTSTVLNQGTIQTGANNAFGITSTGNASTLTNAGTIVTTGPNGYGLDARGTNSTLNNTGTITTSGADSAGFRSTETTAATLIQNSGTVSVTGGSSGDGAGVLFWTGARGTFVNMASGVVSSAADAGVRGANGNITVRNAGTITGGNGDSILLGNGANTIAMTGGQLNGAVIAGSGANQFSMSGGVVNGSLTFGNGGNAFTISGGRINGGIASGSGNDTLTLLTGSTVTGSIDGGGGVNTLMLTGNGMGSFAGALSNVQSLTKSGAGFWSLTGPISGLTNVLVSAGTLSLPGSASAAFTTSLASGGMVQTATNNALGTGVVALNGGTLQTTANNLVIGNAATIATPSGGGYGGIIDTHGNTLTLGGTISGAGALDVSDSAVAPGTQSGGVVVLGGSNTGWTGNTTVDAGTIAVSADANLGASGTTLTLNDGTGISFTNSLTFTHPIALNGDPTFDAPVGVTVTVAAPAYRCGRRGQDGRRRPATDQSGQHLFGSDNGVGWHAGGRRRDRLADLGPVRRDAVRVGPGRVGDGGLGRDARPRPRDGHRHADGGRTRRVCTGLQL